MDILSQLQVIISYLQCQSYCYAKVRSLQDRFIDTQCQSHFLFQALHPTFAQSNVEHVKQRDEHIVDPPITIAIFAHYFKDLSVPQLFMTNEMISECHEFYYMVG